ncbi:MAG: type II toxin-antitoxin system RelE/ParE family toxin [Tepidiformaceae bacterium]
MRIAVREFADREASDAVAWYAERSERAASDFADRLQSAFALLEQSPYAGSRIDRIHRRLPVQRFPYVVIYRVAPEVVTVVAIAHTSREPGYWRHRR